MTFHERLLKKNALSSINIYHFYALCLCSLVWITIFLCYQTTYDSKFNSFSYILPVHFRVIFITITALWFWATCLHALTLLSIHTRLLFKAQATVLSVPSLYKLALTLTVLLICFLTLYWVSFDASKPDILYIPALAFIVFLAILFLPIPIIFPKLRLSLLRGLYSICFSFEFKPPSFFQIILADFLTSFAKVLAEMYLCSCSLFLYTSSPTILNTPYVPNTGSGLSKDMEARCYFSFIWPVITSFPYLIRVRQCLFTFLFCPDKKFQDYKSLANALKYFMAFPVIFLSAAQQATWWHSAQEHWLSILSLKQAWIISYLVFSLYTLYWDIVMDWDLGKFSRWKDYQRLDAPRKPEHLPFLRPVLLYRPTFLYYFAIGIDTLLRFTWALQLSSHVQVDLNSPFVFFVFEILEVFRRWIWLFIRAEKEWLTLSLHRIVSTKDAQDILQLTLPE